MEDDPTTTGPQAANFTIDGEPMTGPEIARRLRALTGANVEEVSPYVLNLRCDLVFKVAGGELCIALEIKGRDSETVEARDDLAPIPLHVFGDVNTLNAFLEDMKRNFGSAMRGRLSHEAALLMRDTARALAVMHGVMNGDSESIIKAHTDSTAEGLRIVLANIPQKRHAGGWSKVALRNAVVVAAYRLLRRGVRGRALTLDAVRDELAAEHGQQAPASGEALRKQLEERGLNWRPLKAAAERHAEAEAGSRAEPPLESPEPDNQTGG